MTLTKVLYYYVVVSQNGSSRTLTLYKGCIRLRMIEVGNKLSTGSG